MTIFKRRKIVTSKEKMKEILDFVQDVTDADWGFMMCLKQDLEGLVIIAQTEGVKEAHEVLKKAWDNPTKE